MFQFRVDGLLVAGSNRSPGVDLGYFRRGYSKLFGSLCLMDWMIGISDLEILRRMVKGCEGACSMRIL